MWTNADNSEGLIFTSKFGINSCFSTSYALNNIFSQTIESYGVGSSYQSISPCRTVSLAKSTKERNLGHITPL